MTHLFQYFVHKLGIQLEQVYCVANYQISPWPEIHYVHHIWRAIWNIFKIFWKIKPQIQHMSIQWRKHCILVRRMCGSGMPPFLSFPVWESDVANAKILLATECVVARQGSQLQISVKARKINSNLLPTNLILRGPRKLLLLYQTNVYSYLLTSPSIISTVK